MANIKSEQLRSDLSLELDKDQPLSKKKMSDILMDLLGRENCYFEKESGKKVFCYNHGGKKKVLLLSAVTYMGGNGQHPICKKRIQLKKWYKDVVDFYKNDKKTDVRFIGVYHYKSNIVFIDAMKETYISKKMNSSAAHIYTNDLFQAMKEGIFKRVDKNGNEVIAIKCIKFKDYIDEKISTRDNNLFSIFEMFNERFDFNHWLSAVDIIPEMHKAGWNKWKETEWPGWFLEYRMSKFIDDNDLKDRIMYVGSSHKKVGELDFDLWFGEEKFYGDLKASDILKKETPGNDKENFVECINKYDRFWYVVYEHDTIKDSDRNYEATKFRANYIRDHNEWPKKKPWDEMSYHSRMKNSVKFVKMFIIELNRVNFREALDDFNQGRQPNGGKRAAKFKITKNNIENFVVFQQDFVEYLGAGGQ